MTLIGLLIAIVILCLVLWVARTLLPMTGLPANIQTVIYVVIVVIAVIWFIGQLTGYSVLRL